MKTRTLLLAAGIAIALTACSANAGEADPSTTSLGSSSSAVTSSTPSPSTSTPASSTAAASSSSTAASSSTSTSISVRIPTIAQATHGSAGDKNTCDFWKQDLGGLAQMLYDRAHGDQVNDAKLAGLLADYSAKKGGHDTTQAGADLRVAIDQFNVYAALAALTAPRLPDEESMASLEQSLADAMSICLDNKVNLLGS